jgi:hypothetical protein
VWVLFRSRGESAFLLESSPYNSTSCREALKADVG